VLVCSQPQTQPWSPDFSASGLRPPSWTRLRVDGQELCNALEDVVWSPNPVQVQLCEVCGTPGCNSGGYADLSRLGGQVLWTATEVDSHDEWRAGRYGPLWALRQGAALFPLPVWQALLERFPMLPAADALPATTRRMLAQAWRAEAAGRLVGNSLADTIGKAGQYVMGSDRWDRDDAVRALRLVADWFAEDPQAAVRGELVGAAWAGMSVETFYTDGPHEEDWPAIGIRDQALSPAFGSDWVLHPSVVHR